MLAERIDPHYALFIRFLSGTGLRYSEATALRRRDITISEGRAVVRGHGSRRGEAKIGPPKTPKAKRTVTCNAGLSAALAEHLPTIGLDDFVFQRPDGDYVRNSRFHKEVWQPLMAELLDAGELDRKPWIHEIRHAHYTHLLDANVLVHVVQARGDGAGPSHRLQILHTTNARRPRQEGPTSEKGVGSSFCPSSEPLVVPGGGGGADYGWPWSGVDVPENARLHYRS